jgi:hypothetical protein
MKDKKIEIENRTKTLDSGNGEFFMVDLKIDDETINTGENMYASFSFWEDMLQQANRALYRIKKNNPKTNFDFNLQTMGMSETEKEARFISHIKGRHADIDVDKILEIFKKEVSEIKVTGPDDNHPNPEFIFPIDSQLNKVIFINVIDKYLKSK